MKKIVPTLQNPTKSYKSLQISTNLDKSDSNPRKGCWCEGVLNKMDEGKEGRGNFIRAALLFGVGLFALLVVFLLLPPLSPDEKSRIHVPPRSIEHVKALALIGSKYTDEYYWNVMLTVATLYIFLQAFSIPGSIGCVFKLLVSLCSTGPFSFFFFNKQGGGQKTNKTNKQVIGCIGGIVWSLCGVSFGYWYVFFFF